MKQTKRITNLLLLKSLMLFFFLLLHNFIIAQKQYRFLQYNFSDGLSQNSISCIYQDKDGLIWIGTQDGLNSFDGSKFVTYKHNSQKKHSISDQFVTSITEDNNGYLWIGTRNGLNKLNKKTGYFEYFNIKNKSKTKNIKHHDVSIADKEGVFVITVNNEYAFYNSKQKKIIEIKAEEMKSVVPVFDSKNQYWWVSYNNKNIYNKFLKDSLAAATPNTKFIQNKIESGGNFAFMDKSDVVWLCNSNNHSTIELFDTKTKQWIRNKISIPARIYHISFDTSNTAWISTNNGIYLVKNQTMIEHIASETSNPYSLPTGEILYTLHDNDNNVWIASANAGIFISHPSFTNFTFIHTPYINNKVKAITELDNTIWFATNNGLYTVNKNNTATLKAFANKQVTALTADENNIWCAVSEEGVFLLNKYGTILNHFTKENNSLTHNTVNQLTYTKSKKIIVLTESGVSIYNSITKQWIKLSTDKSTKNTLHNYFTFNAIEAANKNIWIAGTTGIDILNKDNVSIQYFSSNSDTASFPNTLITKVIQDNKNNFWIATISQGVFYYDGKKITQYSEKNSLTSNIVYSLEIDNQSRVWAISPTGINVFDTTTKQFFPIVGIKGLLSANFSLGAIYKSKNGTIYLGSNVALIAINSNKIQLQKQQLQSIIYKVNVNENSIAFDTSFIELKEDENSVSFEFRTSNFMQPQFVFFQYRLKGFNDEWIDANMGERRVSYTTLPYGKFIFEVRASRSQGNFLNAPIATISIYKKIPFYKTLLFKFLMIAFIVIVLLLLFYFRLKRKLKLQKQKLIAEQMLENERLRISRDLHDNIGAYTSALIAGLNNIPTQQTSKQTETLKEYAQNIMSNLRDSIWVLSSKNIVFTKFVDRFKKYALTITESYPNITLNFSENIKNNTVLPFNITLQLFRILQEVLQNALKHANAKNINIFFEDEHQLLITIEDDGTGFEIEQTQNNSYGLSNIKERVKEIGYDVQINSEPTRGTKIIILQNKANAL